jgi:hypothetical protein
MDLRRLLSALALAAVFDSWGAPDAAAIVGPTREGGAFADRIVMVLTRAAEGSGFCSGVVLAPRIVLTAAHCLRPAADLLVFYRDSEGKPVLAPVAQESAHPKYRADAIRQRVVSIDLGLIETETPLPASFRPAVLAEGEGPPVGDPATLVGFGLAREGEPKTGGSLRAASLRVRAPASRILLWADDPDGGGAGACSGDSGAPIFAADGETVLAIVAWTAGAAGHKCGTLTQGPLVAPLRQWIASTLEHWRP